MLRGPCCGPVILPKSGLVTSVTGFAKTRAIERVESVRTELDSAALQEGEALLDSEVLREEVWSPNIRQKTRRCTKFQRNTVRS